VKTIGRSGLLLALLLLAACDSSPAATPSPGEAKANANPERYARDRDLCRAQVDDYMKTRRNIDDSRREVFRGNYDRYGQTTLPTDMENYGDSRRSDRLIGSCMEQRGWAQQQKSWWQR
jgi:hypothetical protein